MASRVRLRAGRTTALIFSCEIVPALTHPGAPLDRLELVAPDPTAGETPADGGPRLPRDPVVHRRAVDVRAIDLQADRPRELRELARVIQWPTR
jgi:hypothetical protein